MPSRIADALRWYATYTPGKIAIISADGEQSYAQLWSRVRRLSDSLTRMGIKPGDRIALLLVNGPRYIELYQAAALLGAAVVPLNFRFVASEIEYVVNHSGASVLVFDKQFAETVAGLRSKLTSISNRYIVSDGGESPGVHSYERLIELGAEVARKPRPISMPAISRAIRRAPRFSEGLRQSAPRLRRLLAPDGHPLRHHFRRSNSGRAAVP